MSRRLCSHMSLSPKEVNSPLTTHHSGEGGFGRRGTVCLWLVVPLLLFARLAFAQVVGVTMRLDTNVLAIGQSTSLHVYAQVLPAYRTNADQIFSWYVDVLNTNAAAATGNYSAILKLASDNDARTSSIGFTSGANRLAIYDTFLNRAQAGVTDQVELLRFPIIAVAAGQTRFSVRHGTGAPSVSQDFLVAPIDGDQFLTGGDYSAAFASLTVSAPVTNTSVSCLTLALTNLSGGRHQVTLRYCPLAGYDHYVDFRDQVPGTGWQAADGGPFNTGSYRETNSAPARFFRIRAVPADTLVPFRVTLAQVDATRWRLMYPVNARYNYTIEIRKNLVSGAWQPLPGAPHNSGNVVVTNSSPRLFFRVGATNAPP